MRKGGNGPTWQSWKVYNHEKMGGENYVDPKQTANYVLECQQGAPTLVAGDVKMVLAGAASIRRSGSLRARLGRAIAVIASLLL